MAAAAAAATSTLLFPSTSKFNSNSNSKSRQFKFKFKSKSSSNSKTPIAIAVAVATPTTTLNPRPQDLSEENFSGNHEATLRHPHSLPLHSKNPHVLSSHLRYLARLRRLPAALSLLDHLSRLGIPASPTAFAALLSSCADLRDLRLGRQLHAHLRIHRLETNEFLLAKLIQMYASCGGLQDAEQVLASIPDANVYPWNALLRGHVALGYSGDAAAVFKAMRAAGAAANEYSYSCLLKGMPDLPVGTMAHALLVKNAFTGEPEMLMTGLVDFYFKCGKVKNAMRVFEEMPQRDVVAWGAVIAGFAHKGLRREALEYFRLMAENGIEPNSVILTSVVPVIGELSARDLGREIHAFVLKRFRHYTKLVSLLSALIAMYCMCGDMVSGRRVFYSSRERNAVLWTALMSGYAANGRLDQALRSVVWMQQEGVRPDVISVATVLPVCTQLRALRQGKEIHAYTLKSWFLPNVSIATSLITMYASCRCLEYSRRVFEGMVRTNVIAWTALVDAYLKNGDSSSALDVFRSMQLLNRRPDAVAIARMLSACGDLRALKLGKELHVHVLKRKMDLIPLVAAEVVSMYGRCGDLKKAHNVFDRVQSKGSLTCTAIIEAYAFNGRYKEARNLFVWMLSGGFVPNNYTFDVMLKICDAAGLHNEALGIFNSMVREYNLEPSEDNYECIIGLLSHADRISEAQRFVDLKATLFDLPVSSVQRQ